MKKLEMCGELQRLDGFIHGGCVGRRMGVDLIEKII